MQDKKIITKYVSEWLARAEEDLQVAEILLKEGEGHPSSICFHCQQSAEKYFKGYLAFQETNVRKVHELEPLLKMCSEIDTSFNELQADAESLSKYYIETRYPGDIPEFSLQEAKDAYEAAKRIQEFVMNKIKE